MKQYDAISLVTMTTLQVTSHDLIYRYILVWKICGVQSGNSWGSERWRVSPLRYDVYVACLYHKWYIPIMVLCNISQYLTTSCYQYIAVITRQVTLLYGFIGCWD